MSEQPTIEAALDILNPLLSSLENAYWDSSNIEVKDIVFDLTNCIHGEMNELAKLSINDLSMPYEPITPAFRHSCMQLRNLMHNLHHYFHRTQTVSQLEHLIPKAASLLNKCSLKPV